MLGQSIQSSAPVEAEGEKVENWFAAGAFVLACATSILAIRLSRIRAPTPGAHHGADAVPRVFAPPTVVETLQGTSSWIPSTPDALVFFTLAGCSYCERLLTEVAAARLKRPYLVIQQGESAPLRAQGERLGLPLERLVADPDGKLLDSFGIDRVPHMLKLESGRIVRSISVDELVEFTPALFA